mgnify:CR=1 FL=1
MKKVNFFLRNKIRLFILFLGLFIINGHFYIRAYPQIERLFKNIPIPALNCYSVPTTIWACPLGTFQHFLAIGFFSFVTTGMVLLVGILIGRWACGWLCPFGFVQELLHHIKTRKFKLPYWTGHIKTAVFFLLVLILPLLLKSTVFCKTCPAGALGAGIPHVLINSDLQRLVGVLFIAKMIFLIIVLLASVFYRRPFCSVICPLGWAFGLFNKVSLLKLRFNSEKCYNCNLCRVECPMGIDPTTQYNSVDCIRCMNCVKQRCNAMEYYFSIGDRKTLNNEKKEN